MTPRQRAESAMLALNRSDYKLIVAVTHAIEDAVAEEREACAKVADIAQVEDVRDWQAREMADRIAAAIRKRGQS